MRNLKKYDLIADRHCQLKRIVLSKSGSEYLCFGGQPENNIHHGIIWKVDEDFLKYEYGLLVDDAKKQSLIDEYELKMALSINAPYHCRHCNGTLSLSYLLRDVDFLNDSEII